MQDAFENWMDAKARAAGGDWFDGKVVGVTQPGRQEAIRTLEEQEELSLDPEPENPFDSNAIAVRTSAGEQIGYLDKRLAGELTRRMRQGTRAQCFVRSIRERDGISGVSFGLLQYRS